MLTTTDSRSIRDWARANGIEVGSRGVLPWLVVQAYWDAHGTGAEKPAPPPPNPWKPRVARNSDIGWTVHTGGGVTVRVPSWAAGMGLAAAICRRYREGSALLANHGLVDG
jgi:hypothetical protein